MQTQFEIPTCGQGLYEFTDEVIRWTSGQGDGLLTLFVRHTSCSLLIQENADAEVQTDLRQFFARLVPPTTDPRMSYLTHTYEGPDDMPAHIKAAMMPVSLSIPVTQGVRCWAHGKVSICLNTEMRRTRGWWRRISSHDKTGKGPV